MTERTDRGIAVLMLIALVAVQWIWFDVDTWGAVCTVLVVLFAIGWVIEYVRERRGLIPPSQPREPELLSRRRLWFSVGGLAAVATIGIGMGLAILLSPDSLGAATPDDAHWAGGMMIVLGLIVAAFAGGTVATQRRLRRLAASPCRHADDRPVERPT
jgi:hypothetical protein